VDIPFKVGGRAHVLRLLPLVEEGKIHGVLAMTRAEMPGAGSA
jgi:hypothetical protein